MGFYFKKVTTKNVNIFRYDNSKFDKTQNVTK